MAVKLCAAPSNQRRELLAPFGAGGVVNHAAGLLSFSASIASAVHLLTTILNLDAGEA
jgi:hypothetical protein